MDKLGPKKQTRDRQIPKSVFNKRSVHGISVKRCNGPTESKGLGLLQKTTDGQITNRDQAKVSKNANLDDKQTGSYTRSQTQGRMPEHYSQGR